MATPLSASYRLTMLVTVDGFQHKARAYTHVIPGFGPSGYDLVLRDGSPGVDAASASNGWFANFAAAYDATKSSFDGAILEFLSGTAWLPIASLPTTIVPTGGAAYTKAGQLTQSFRDTAFHKVRAINLETIEATGVRTILNPTNAAYWLVAPATGVATAWNWQRGRSNLYIGSGIAAVTDLNNRLRRHRGIA